jgi:hypothetical protein
MAYALDEDLVPPWARPHLAKYQSGELGDLIERISAAIGAQNSQLHRR